MANLSNINNKFIVTDGGNGRVLIGATNDIGATLFANHPSTTAPSLTFNAPAGQVFENEDLQIAFGLNNASPYNAYMQTRFVSAPYYRNLAINPLGGNVGIGTNSPSYKLHVVGNINIQGTGGYLRWNSGDMAIVNAGSYAMAFETYTGSALTEKMRISSLGVVSVGTTSPITDPFVSTNQFQQFQVGKSGVMGSYTNSAGEAMFSNNIYVGSTHQTFQALDTSVNGTAMFLYNDYIAFKCGTTAANGVVSMPEQMRITSGGQVKINTTLSSLGKLSVRSDSGASTFYNNIQCVPSDSTTGGLFIGSNVANDAIMVTGAYYQNAGNYTPTSTSASSINMFSGNIVFRANSSLTVGTNYVPTERMRINADGDVGIGTTNPSGKLEVNGNNYNTNSLTTFTLRDLGNNYSDGDNSIDIVMRSRYWSGDANTSQNSKIRHLKDNSNGSTGTMLQFGTTTEGSGDASTKMTIKANGNVGLGNTIPYSRLDINGVLSIGPASLDPNFTVTTTDVSTIAGGSIELVQGFGGTTTSGDTIVFTYEAQSWKAFQYEYCISAAYGLSKGGGGGYNNNGMTSYYYVTTNQGSNVNVTSVVSNSGGSSNQYVIVTITGVFGIHPCVSFKYTQSGGDGAPRADRATLAFNS